MSMSRADFDPRKYRVALLSGGRSRERKVSLASGEGALDALREAGFAVEHIDPAENGELMRLLEERFDVAFICLHGKNGEDGSIQGLLEVLQIPYIGSGIWSSATALDKSKAKSMFRSADIPTPPSITVTSRDVAEGSFDVEEVCATVGERCVVKATTEGSSLGLSMVSGRDEIVFAVREACETYGAAIVERYLEGIEFTVVVLGNEAPYALPVIKIEPSNDFYDYEAKYAPGGSRHLCPAPIDDELRDSLQEYAVGAHRALECAGLSRSDFIVDGNGRPWILETNTIPGMTKTSLLPDAARAAGMTFSEVCTEIVRLALERFEGGFR